MKRLALIATLVAFGSLAFGQTEVFRVDDQATTSYGPAGPTGTFLGQPPSSSWTRWPERGPGYDMGSAQVLTEGCIYYLCNNADALTGNENVTVQIYANDGAATTSDQGHSFNKPGTLLFTSAPIKVIPGDANGRFSIPSVSVPAKFTMTLKFQGGLFDVAPFDPGVALDIPGGRFWGGPVGFTGFQGTAGVMYRQVFTSAGPSGFIAQERPATFPQDIPFIFASTFWSGNTSLIATPYDLGSNLYNSDGFLGIADGGGAQFVSTGNQITLSGTARKVTSIDFGYYADTVDTVGSPTYNLKLYKVNGTDAWVPGGTPDLTQLLWDSGPKAIPLGMGGGGSGALVQDTFTVPNVVVPDTFCWVMTTTGISGIGDDLVGPGAMWSPNPGNCPNFFLGDDGTGFNEWVFGSGPKFDVLASLGPITIHASNASSTERLAPVAQAVSFGKISSGNLASLAADDNNPEVICKFFVPNPQSPFVQTDLTFNTTKANPTAIVFEVKAKWNNAGAYQIQLSQKNFSTNQFDITKAYTNLGGAYTIYSGSASGTLTNYVSAGTTVGRIQVKQTGPSTALLPCMSFEYANQLVTG